MNLKLRTLMIDLFQILLRFIIAYLLTTIILYHINSSAALYNLGLIPIPFFSYLIQKKSKHIWSFVLLHCALFPIYILTTYNMVAVITFCLYILFTAILSYCELHHRFTKSNLYFIVLFVLLYLILSAMKQLYLAQFTFYLAILYALICILNQYLINFNHYFLNHDGITNIPYQQIKNSNHVLLLFLGLLFISVIIIFSRLPLTDLLIRIGKALLRLFASFLMLFVGEESSSTEQPVENTSQDPPILETSAFLQIISKVMEWLFIIISIVVVIALISYCIYKIYQYFYIKMDDKTTDQVEFLSPFTKKEVSVRPHHKFAVKLFGRSNNAIIRKYFYKAVSNSSGNNSKLQKDLTPSELAELVKPSREGTDPGRISEDRMLITKYYEKARYSKEECSKEEVRKMKELLK